MEYEVEGSKPRGRPKRTWQRLCKKTVRHINREDAMDCSRWEEADKNGGSR